MATGRGRGHCAGRNRISCSVGGERHQTWPFIPAPPPALMVAFLGCFCQAVVSLATSHHHAAGGRGTRPAACGFCVQHRNHWLHGAHLGSLPTAVDLAPCGPSLQAARPTPDHPWKLDPRRWPILAGQGSGRPESALPTRCLPVETAFAVGNNLQLGHLFLLLRQSQIALADLLPLFSECWHYRGVPHHTQF